MAHCKLEFVMPASCSVVFDAFHYHLWRLQWDSLVRNTQVEGGAPCPYVGAISYSGGKGWMKGLSMQTRFISYAPPHLAAASMVGVAFPFSRWAASMRHRELDAQSSLLIYSYTLEAGPSMLIRWLSPLVNAVFKYQTRKRFARLQAFLERHAQEVLAWQRNGRVDALA